MAAGIGHWFGSLGVSFAQRIEGHLGKPQKQKKNRHFLRSETFPAVGQVNRVIHGELGTKACLCLF